LIHNTHAAGLLCWLMRRLESGDTTIDMASAEGRALSEWWVAHQKRDVLRGM
jgi:hypothetical protein